MKITLLVDKQQHDFLQSEFGLAMLLESNSGTFLFDCGADSALLVNTARLQIADSRLEKVILSHGHYDHTGGLAKLQPQVIYCAENITAPHYSFHSADDIHEIAMPPAAQQVLNASRQVVIKAFTFITPDIALTGPILRQSSEDCGGRFFHDQACTLPDIVSEEQALLTADGVLISGCCHAGIINTVKHCQQASSIKIHTIVGGLHLRNASSERLQQTADFIRHNQIKNLYLMHCTGSNAIEFLRNALPECNVYMPQLGESWVC